MIYRRMFAGPTWNLRGPFNELQQLRNQMDSFLSKVPGNDPMERHAGVFPSINLTEDEESFHIRAELPGIPAKDLDIQATGNNLSISGERKIETEGADVRYHRRERESGKFSRAISLPGDIDSDGISAGLSNGILKIRIPKAAKVKPKKIDIK